MGMRGEGLVTNMLSSGAAGFSCAFLSLPVRAVTCTLHTAHCTAHCALCTAPRTADCTLHAARTHTAHRTPRTGGILEEHVFSTHFMIVSPTARHCLESLKCCGLV